MQRMAPRASNTSRRLLRYAPSLRCVGFCSRVGPNMSASDMSLLRTQATIAKFESHASTTGRRPALALIVTPPSSSLPALNRRSDDPLAAFRTAPRIVAAGPVLNERDFVGKCFANEKDLVNATSNCLGRGTPHLSTKGARRCYICQCKPTTDGNQKTYWVSACLCSFDRATTLTSPPIYKTCLPCSLAKLAKRRTSRAPLSCFP